MRQNSLQIADVMPIVRASGLLVSRCTIMRFGGDFDDGGAPVNTYTAVDGLTDIPCIASPLNLGDRGVLDERRSPTEIQAQTDRHILLDGYYPDIRDDDRAVVDGTAYDIGNIESDSQSQMTRIIGRRVSI